jgi:hypothetical protein
MSGVAPSMTRQLDNELAQKLANAETGEENLTETGESVKTEVVKQKRGFGFNKKTMWEASNRQISRPGSPKKHPIED